MICGHLDPDLAVIADELLEPDELLHADEAADSEPLELERMEPREPVDHVDPVEPAVDRALASGAEDRHDAELDEHDERQRPEPFGAPQQPLPIDGVVSTL